MNEHPPPFGFRRWGPRRQVCTLQDTTSADGRSCPHCSRSAAWRAILDCLWQRFSTARSRIVCTTMIPHDRCIIPSSAAVASLAWLHATHAWATAPMASASLPSVGGLPYDSILCLSHSISHRFFAALRCAYGVLRNLPLRLIREKKSPRDIYTRFLLPPAVAPPTCQHSFRSFCIQLVLALLAY